MIIVLGRPGLRLGSGAAPDRLDGAAARIALVAAGRGARVELVGSVGDDPAGDRVTVLLGEAGVGHAALLRDPGGSTPVAGAVGAASLPRLESEDVELGLHYVPDCRVLVIVDELSDEAVAAAVSGAAFHGAAVVAVVTDGRAAPGGLPEEATLLSMPAADSDGGDAVAAAFAGLVGGYAAALDAGRAPAEAFRDARAAVGWEPAGEG